MENLSIKLNNGNSNTVVTYDEKKASIFWSEQYTNSYNSESKDAPDSNTISFNEQLKRVMKVPKSKK